MNFDIPIDKWITALVNFLLDYAQPFFDLVNTMLYALTYSIEGTLLFLPSWLLIIILTLLAWWRTQWQFAVFTLVGLLLVAGMGLWTETIVTLALVLASTIVSLLIGIPLGILAARNDAFERLLRPILDLMQTMPAFVYLIPAAMFFGLGRVPGIVATIIFAMPPAVRLTNLGIRHVPKELVETGLAFGCTNFQLLLRVQLPSALPSIMTGINQTIMLALSMVVIASMIGAGGLGDTVLKGIQRLDVGLGFEGGLCVVILAVILDRITQGVTKSNNK